MRDTCREAFPGQEGWEARCLKPSGHDVRVGKMPASAHLARVTGRDGVQALLEWTPDLIPLGSPRQLYATKGPRREAP